MERGIRQTKPADVIRVEQAFVWGGVGFRRGWKIYRSVFSDKRANSAGSPHPPPRISSRRQLRQGESDLRISRVITKIPGTFLKWRDFARREKCRCFFPARNRLHLVPSVSQSGSGKHSTPKTCILGDSSLFPVCLPAWHPSPCLRPPFEFLHEC